MLNCCHHQQNSNVFNRLLGQELFDRFLWFQKLKGRLHNSIEQEGKVDKQSETGYLQPLERLPAEAERDNPDEKGAARVDGRARRGADGACDREAKEVETAL